MNSRTIITALVMLLFVTATGVAQEESAAAVAEVVADSVVSTDSSLAVVDQLIVTYFHGDRRCATCQKLESYSHEAIVAEFGHELEAGTLVWRTVNYDQDDNKHFIDDYQLFTKALILSQMSDTVEVSWLNLDKIWQLVGDKEEYVDYVQKRTRSFMEWVAEAETESE